MVMPIRSQTFSTLLPIRPSGRKSCRTRWLSVPPVWSLYPCSTKEDGLMESPGAGNDLLGVCSPLRVCDLLECSRDSGDSLFRVLEYPGNRKTCRKLTLLWGLPWHGYIINKLLQILGVLCIFPEKDQTSSGTQLPEPAQQLCTLSW